MTGGNGFAPPTAPERIAAQAKLVGPAIRQVLQATVTDIQATIAEAKAEFEDAIKQAEEFCAAIQAAGESHALRLDKVMTDLRELSARMIEEKKRFEPHGTASDSAAAVVGEQAVKDGLGPSPSAG